MALQVAVWFRVELHANLIEGHAQQSVFGCPLVLGEDHKNILPGLLGLPSSFRVTLRLDLRCVGGWKCSLMLVLKPGRSSVLRPLRVHPIVDKPDGPSAV